MNASLMARPLSELTTQYGPMRTVISSDTPTDVPRERADAYRFNLLGGDVLRESVINDENGDAMLIIRCVQYSDPVTGATRYAVDYWSVLRYSASDHSTRVLAELSYEEAVRGEFARPTLRLSPQRFTRGLASFYDVTDVRP